MNTSIASILSEEQVSEESFISQRINKFDLLLSEKDDYGLLRSATSVDPAFFALLSGTKPGYAVETNVFRNKHGLSSDVMLRAAPSRQALEEVYGFRYIFYGNEEDPNADFMIYDPAQLQDASSRNNDILGNPIDFELLESEICSYFKNAQNLTAEEHRRLGVFLGIPDSALNGFAEYQSELNRFKSVHGFNFPNTEFLDSYIKDSPDWYKVLMDYYNVLDEINGPESFHHLFKDGIVTPQDPAKLAKYSDFLYRIYQEFVFPRPEFSGDWRELAKLSILRRTVGFAGTFFSQYKNVDERDFDQNLLARWKALNQHYIDNYMEAT